MRSFVVELVIDNIASDFYYKVLLLYAMNMYVGNLNYRVKEGDLEQAMSAYGVVTSVKVIKDRETGKSKGFAFVEMEDDQDAAKAINELNGSEFMGRQLVIKEALPKRM